MAFAVSSLIYFILLSLPYLTIARTGNVTLGESLTATDDNSSWVSPSGDFAFGFRQINGTGGFHLAIWFNKIPEKTIVWSANRNNLAPEGSKIQLTTEGRFVLDGPNGNIIWSADLGSGAASYGAMLDSGNFVLESNNSPNTSTFLWQSFDYPTDTMLPTQRLSQGKKLVSSFSNKNLSSGRFQFEVQKGELVLSTRNFPLDAALQPYWPTTTNSSGANQAYWPTTTVGIGFEVIFNQSGYFYLTASNGSILKYVFEDPLRSQFYQRVVLEYDGVLIHYVYPKSAGSTGGRPMEWSPSSTIPENICMSISLWPKVGTGGGACGFNSFCTLTGDRRPICKCPHGYIPMNPNDALSGCKQNFIPQNCDAEVSRETDLFGFSDMANTDWISSEYDHFQAVSEDWCREECLRDCFCAVAIFRGGDCWKKRNPLSYGRMDPSLGLKALIKIRKQNSTGTSPGARPEKKKDQSTLIISGSVLLGSSMLLNFVLLVSTRLVLLGFNRRKTKMLQSYSVVPGLNLRSFTYNELEDATNKFNEELGSGASGTVYKGFLENENGKIVAVKKLDKIVSEGEKEFKAEISTISGTNHKNLVQLLGYCNDGEHRLLVYEFMSNGSLATFLFQNSTPNWYRRIQIAFGTARGLCYLHHECSTQIIHCDIKPQNVLLDESFTAKISDFGLSKLLKIDQSRTTTGIRGTKGYVAPEWFRDVPITIKVDVYSFGILLLELICCRRNVKPNIECEDEITLSDWACDCYGEGKLQLLVENDEEAKDDVKRFEKFVMIAIWCIQEDPSLRPTMKKVTQMLEGSVEVSAPPNPSSYISSPI